MNKFMGGLTLGIVLTSCFFIFYNPFQQKAFDRQVLIDPIASDTPSSPVSVLKSDSLLSTGVKPLQINAAINRDSLVGFAKSLLGVQYLYGSTDPARGFDCSGFITYVFNHFNKVVPRSSYEFINMGKRKSLQASRPGDIILFTGTDSAERTIGHIGIICDIVNGSPSFIHSTSGKADGVTITSMENIFYQDRFIAVTDLFESPTVAPTKPVE